MKIRAIYWLLSPQTGPNEQGLILRYFCVQPAEMSNASIKQRGISIQMKEQLNSCPHFHRNDPEKLYQYHNSWII